VDESDTGQILTVEELRALRDRMGAEAAAARQPRSAAQVEVPTPPAVIPLEARAEPWEAPRHRARPRQSWPRRLAAVGCLALAGGTVTVLVITAHTRSDPRSAGEVSVPVLPAPAVSVPVVSVPVVSVPPVTTSSAPEPVSSTSPAPVVPPVPVAAARGGFC
jgi:hypothetical protein